MSTERLLRRDDEIFEGRESENGELELKVDLLISLSVAIAERSILYMK